MRTGSLGLAAILAAAAVPVAAEPWVAGWATAPVRSTAEQRLDEKQFRNATLRQVVRVTIGGRAIRVRFSNRFGTTPLRIAGAHVALAVGPAGARTRAGSDLTLRFAGATEVEVPPGADFWSDPVPLAVRALDDVAISTRFAVLPQQQTGHVGARTRSWIAPGDRLGDAGFAGAAPVERWFQIAGVEVDGAPRARAIVALGDSITDGYGVKDGSHLRWTDGLARRLLRHAATRDVAVLNQGIGGNCLLVECNGTNALARFDSDVASQPGARYLIVLAGINDLGGFAREQAVTDAEQRAHVARMIAGYAQIVARARALGMKAIGGTVMPFVGNDYYHPDAAAEAARQAVNAWIRMPGHFDAIVDFDRVVRDPARPDRLLPAYDSGDHLHPSMAGYRAMAEAVPLRLFAR
ncbi:SGNH/GDSL hydrolase family protein [Sphingomonas sp. 2R-10]|uniref:SGNH/GDSL hydrolase family protein n=1 Tax=Sphingomonas sp. 2R-10 TaxID=3045148 RepID=UPI000F7699D3|nr:SGNH/GDSL hydrolase family protein [Sphingomonas sp. 2R-10]MDJ0278511.1 SGNH/GDSL hydrolase family protein [Sphingomonas sp. 2R-10]